MEDDVAEVKFRLYGRFVYAEAMQEGSDAASRVSVIAPNFDEQLFGRHQVLMSVQRGRVVFGDGATTAEPTTRLASAAPIEEAELLVWDLSGLRVTYGISASNVTLRPRSGEVLALPRLESLQGRTAELDPSALRPDANGISNAIIELTAGEGVAAPALASASVLLSTVAAARDSLLDAQQTAVRDPDTQSAIEAVPADLVEFAIPLPNGQRALTLTLTGADGTARRVTVREGTTVVFTNLCSHLHAPRTFDLEFSQYYNLLKSDPGADALIPVERPKGAMDPGPLSEGIDCIIQARIPYLESAR
jgi:hypothetical protein